MTQRSGTEKLSLAATVVLMASAVVVSGLSVRREFGQRAPNSASQPVARPDWLTFAKAGYRIGRADASAVLVVFSDYQCPYCQRFEYLLDSVRARFPDNFAVVYRNLPLTRIHPHAFGAALASICAGKQGRFAQMHSILFENAQELGTVPWHTLADRANVPDTTVFNRCLADPTTRSVVEADLAAADRLGARGTPVSLIGGYAFRGLIPQALIDSLVRSAVASATQ